MSDPSDLKRFVFYEFLESRSLQAVQEENSIEDESVETNIEPVDEVVQMDSFPVEEVKDEGSIETISDISISGEMEIEIEQEDIGSRPVNLLLVIFFCSFFFSLIFFLVF
jgi:hypothetical protein